MAVQIAPKTETDTQRGILLINLGTPDDPSPEAVSIYLKQFLMDPLVIDIPFLFRWIFVNWLVVPRRSKESSKLYKKIWTKRGSPLLIHTRELTQKLRLTPDWNTPVEFGMRYGQPSIKNGIQRLLHRGVDEILLCPLYPQYSLAASESSLVEAKHFLAKRRDLSFRELPPFYKDPAFIDALVATAKEALWDKKFDYYIFSFHGLPERHIRKTDSSKTHCLKDLNCCSQIMEANRQCYRAQCFETARLMTKRLEIPADQYQVAFQSRLGRSEWIKPYTDKLYKSLPQQGVKTLAVFCPSFVADCLETLEEVEIRGKKAFLEAGGEELFMVPSLNSSPQWVHALQALLKGDLT